MYIGNAFISQQFTMQISYKVAFSIFLWIFSISMIYKYAPADTEDIPVISEKERRKRKNLSYVIVSIMIITGCLIRNNTISNILLVGVLLQTISITRVAYNLTNNKYGYEEYWKSKNVNA